MSKKRKMIPGTAKPLTLENVERRATALNDWMQSQINNLRLVLPRVETLESRLDRVLDRILNENQRLRIIVKGLEQDIAALRGGTPDPYSPFRPGCE